MYNFIPKSTNDMVFSNTTSETLIHNILKGNLPFPKNGVSGLLFYGVYGTGKTTYADIFCNELEIIRGGQQGTAHIQLIDCGKVTDFSKTIKNCEGCCNLIPLTYSNLVYFIFDEVNYLKLNEQRLLKAFMEKENIVCILTTNHLNRVDDGLRDRCYEIDFNAANPNDYLPRLRQLIVQNNLTPLSNKLLLRLVQQSNGSWRTIWLFIVASRRIFL
jgi:DNA polymerase III delta prime subunit